MASTAPASIQAWPQRAANDSRSAVRGHPRATDTGDLSARLLFRGGHFARRRVLDLSATGARIAADDLAAGAVIRFELTGPGFRSAGTAEVVHCDGQTIGLRFMDLESLSEEQLYGVVFDRLIWSE
ncbi:MAG: PilZ domain-containing protein [Solirubrobacteraceae bacterium]